MNRDEARSNSRKLLGDRLTALAKITGVAVTVRAIERITGWRCGCERRTAALNRWDAKR